MAEADSGVSLEELLFFDGKEGALPLYLALRARVLSQLGDCQMLAQKSQITFRAPHPYCWVSRPQRGNVRAQRAASLVVSFCVSMPVEDGRIWQRVEPYPGRFMHHVILNNPA